jgi:DNA helicase-2/ATP-dependent DNA helicase PcrA
MALLDELNPQQRQAVTAGPGPVLVVAGPGSGKTRVLAYRLAFLVLEGGLEASRILAVTFTNKAAREMRSRAEGLLARTIDPALQGSGLRLLSAGTFHSLCARWLRRDGGALGLPRDYVIYDEDDQERVVRQALDDLTINDKQYRPGAMLSAISKAKNDMLGPQAFSDATPWERNAGRVYARYQELLAANRAVDFDDLLLLAVRLFDEHPDVRARYQEQFAHILVDEFQDTNAAQYRLVHSLAVNHRNLFAVGDADQSIYRWRGADYRNVQRFLEDFPEARTILLEENYRSTQNILDAAMAVIRRNARRVDKQLFTERGAGAALTLHEAYNEDDEALYVVDTIATLTAESDGGPVVRPGDCAVMYRTNAQSRALEEAFLRANLPYKLVGAQRFYGRREVKDALSFLRLVSNPADGVSLARILNVPARGLGERSADGLIALAVGQGHPAGEILLDLGRDGQASPYAAAFRGRVLSSMIHFGRMFATWRELRAQVTPAELAQRVLEDVGYRAHVDDGTEEGAQRWENVEELVAVAREFDALPLERFLEEVALVSDQDTLSESADAPTLLTLHAAKGLEFPVVFIIGLDEGVLPHQRSLDDPEALAEERRLCYVGITRAKDRLFLVRAFRRSSYGAGGVCDPSRFLRDLPPHLLAQSATAEPQARWGRPQRAAWEWEPAQRRTAEAPAPAARYTAGMRVSHSLFGEGMILESRVRGEDEEVTVMFDQAGLKRLDGQTAPLTVLPEGG